MSGVRLLNRPAARWAIAAVLAIEAMVIVSIYGFERVSLRVKQNQIKYNQGKIPDHSWFQYPSNGILRPPIATASESGMRPDEAVIGVEVGGKARAYRLHALDDRNRHIVNDLIDGVPVSIAYCDITDCVQVYTDPRRSTPLDVALAGLYDREMVVKLDGTLYFHKSNTLMKPGTGPATIPYKLLSPTRVTWKEWVQRHPETDVYVGERQNEQE